MRISATAGKTENLNRETHVLQRSSRGSSEGAEPGRTLRLLQLFLTAKFPSFFSAVMQNASFMREETEVTAEITALVERRAVADPQRLQGTWDQQMASAFFIST